MYSETVTLFNRARGGDGRLLWYPTVLTGVDFSVGSAAVVRQYGTVTGDRAMLGVRYSLDDDGEIIIAGSGGKKWLAPRAWRASSDAIRRDSVTFGGGSEFDFFIGCRLACGDVIEDGEFDEDGGFYSFCNRIRDDVFAVNSVSRFLLIPHLEITGR